ncbi:MAG: response regulator [Rhodospirillaceae bacterium]|nr:response regulator [Rhodospirillaceae bacterium]MBL6941694.1 response regulator [Rhodospirillales bacterium]
MADYDLSNLSVLIVDDYQPMRLILKNVLHALGIKTIAEAPGGLEALTILKSSNVDIVFADNLMEPMNGIELVERIRAGEDNIDPFTSIIMVSGYSDLAQIIKARDAGINEFLAKPISAKMVYLRICSVIEHPRSFIKAETFLGPDRRRREAMIDGEERRDGEYDYDEQKRTKERTKE